MYSYLDTSTPNSGLGTPLRSGGEIINANFRKLHFWVESRANIATSTIPTLAAGGPRYLLAAEYVPGSPMPLALYERTSTPPSDVTNPGWALSADNQWWKQFPPGGVLFNEQFGGKADSNSGGAVATDNLIAFNYMAAFPAAGPNGANKLCWGPGYHYFSDTPELHTRAHLTGVNGGYEMQGSTFWMFPPNKQFIRFRHFTTTGNYTTGASFPGSATGSTMEHFVLWGSGSSTTFDQPAVDADVVVHLDFVSVVNAAGHGFYVHADTSFGTIADFSTINRCTVQNARGDCLHIWGNDANVIHVSNFSARGGEVWGCSVYNAGQLGNKFDNIHCAGYRNVGVQYLGRKYVAVRADTLYAATPTDSFSPWYDIGELAAPNSQFPAWSSTPAASGYGSTADPYRPSLPFLTSGGPDVIDNLYIEGDGQAHVPGQGMIFGGTYGATKTSNSIMTRIAEPGTFFGSGVGSWQLRLPGQTGHNKVGSNAFVLVGGTANGEALDLLNYYSDWNGGSIRYTLSYASGDVLWGRVSSGYFPFMGIASEATARTFGRATPQKDKIFFTDIGLASPTDFTMDARFIGMRGSPPAEGSHAKGEFFFNNNTPNEGTLGWANVVTGTGTWGNVPIFGLTAVTPQRNGEVVLERTSNTLLTFKCRGTDGTTRTATITLS